MITTDHHYASRFGPAMVLLVGCTAAVAGSLSKLSFVLEWTIVVVFAFSIVFRAICLFPFSGQHVPLNVVIATKRMASVLQVLPIQALVVLGLNWLTYVAASTAFPIRDAELAWLDSLMGFDWLTVMQTLDGYPGLVDALRLAYKSLYLQIIALPMILVLTGHFARYDWFLAALVISCLFAVVLSGLIPSHGPAQLNALPTTFENLRFSGAWVRPIVDGLRDGSVAVISAETMKGIVTFPSMHAALALINTIAFRPLPLVFWPLVGVNALMIPATVTEGGHYVTDVVVGIVIALIAMRLASAVVRIVEPARSLSSRAAPVGGHSVADAEPSR
jgi:membrane-associated phospholipid phosphatase